MPYEIYSVPVYSSDHLYPQSRSDVLDVVYDESDFQSNTIDYDKSDFLTSDFENETGSEFSKTKDVLNKIKNYRQQMKWRRVGQQIDRQFDAILSIASNIGVQVRKYKLVQVTLFMMNESKFC